MSNVVCNENSVFNLHIRYPYTTVHKLCANRVEKWKWTMKKITWIVFSGEMTLLVWIINRKKNITYNIKCQLQSHHLANIIILFRIWLLNHTQILYRKYHIPEIQIVNIKLLTKRAKTDICSVTSVVFSYVILISGTLWVWNLHEGHVYTSICSSKVSFSIVP